MRRKTCAGWTAKARSNSPMPRAGGPARALELSLNGGEDYELLFAAAASVKMPRSVAGVRVTRIGRLVRGAAISLVEVDGTRRALKPGGWEHFRGKR